MSQANLETISSNWKKPFFTIWTGQIFSLLGSSLAQFALIWWLTRTSGSAKVLAGATLIGMLPQIFLGPFAGALVDRWNRRLVMMAADGMIALASLWLAVQFLTGQAEIWQVYVVLFIRSAGGAFHWPAMQASTSLMVPGAHLARVAGMNQMLNGAVNIIAPPLGAMLIELFSVQTVLFIDVATALIAILPLTWVAIPQPVPQASAAAASVWNDLKAGFRYVWSWPGLLILLLGATLINFISIPAFSLLPLMITRHFNAGALELGWMQTAWGVGMVIGGLLLSIWGGFKRKVITSLAALAVAGVGQMLLGFTPGHLFFLALAAQFITGVMIPLVNGPLFAIMQTVVDANMQGRVMALMGTFATAAAPISLAVAGPLADRYGVQLWYVLSGITFLIMGGVSFFLPALLNLEDGRAQPGQTIA